MMWRLRLWIKDLSVRGEVSPAPSWEYLKDSIYKMILLTNGNIKLESKAQIQKDKVKVSVFKTKINPILNFTFLSN